MGAQLSALAAVGLIITKSVDLLRNAFDRDDRYPKAWWQAASFGLGIGAAFLVCNIEPIALALHAPTGQGCVGLVLTGLGVGSVASLWHEIMAALSSISHRGDTGPRTPKGLLPGPRPTT